VFTGRTIVIATGAQYCKRQIPDVDRFNGTVVFSAATAVEAQRCSQAPVLIVGGGNSAWQAALGRPAAQCQFRGFARMAGCAAWMITGFYGWLRSVVG
jgi:hypothetical protein